MTDMKNKAQLGMLHYLGPNSASIVDTAMFTTWANLRRDGDIIRPVWSSTRDTEMLAAVLENRDLGLLSKAPRYTTACACSYLRGRAVAARLRGLAPDSTPPLQPDRCPGLKVRVGARSVPLVCRRCAVGASCMHAHTRRRALLTVDTACCVADLL